MIKIEYTDVYGWEAAIRGMRNPMNSWDKSDSNFDMWIGDGYKIGEADLKLMQNLAKAGSDHSKYLRMINVTCDITAPLYWWKEFETYRAGVTPLPMDIEMNSCSTMHKIHDKKFTLDDFSNEHLLDDGINAEYDLDGCGGIICLNGTSAYTILVDTVAVLNAYREMYLETKDKRYWWQMIQLLPSSYNQRRTVQLNYAVLKNMYHARKNHKLDEWREFCKWCETLPYFKEVCIQE